MMKDTISSSNDEDDSDNLEDNKCHQIFVFLAPLKQGISFDTNVYSIVNKIIYDPLEELNDIQTNFKYSRDAVIVLHNYLLINLIDIYHKTIRSLYAFENEIANQLCDISEPAKTRYIYDVITILAERITAIVDGEKEIILNMYIGPADIIEEIIDKEENVMIFYEYVSTTYRYESIKSYFLRNSFPEIIFNDTKSPLPRDVLKCKVLFGNANTRGQDLLSYGKDYIREYVIE